MVEDNHRATKRHRDLSMEDEEKLSEGRKRFRAKNDDDALDGAEILFRMNRRVLDVENAVKLVEYIDHHRISKAKTFCQDQFEDGQHQGSSEKPVPAQPIHGGAAIFDEQPPFGYSIDGTKLPRLPPLKRLEGIIERCSKPFEKQLTLTDTSKTHNRLAFNKDDVKLAILPLLNLLNYRDKDLEDGIPVTTYDSRGKKYPMVFKAWAKNKVYVLNTVGWNEFVKDNQLVGFKDWVSVWVFSRKQTGKLCFALNVKRFPTPASIKKRSKREGPN